MIETIKRRFDSEYFLSNLDVVNLLTLGLGIDRGKSRTHLSQPSREISTRKSERINPLEFQKGWKDWL